MQLISLKHLEDAYYRCRTPESEWVHFRELYLDLKKHEYLHFRVKNFQNEMRDIMPYLPKDKYSFAAGTINIEINKKYGAISREDHKLYCYFKIEDLLIKG